MLSPNVDFLFLSVVFFLLGTIVGSFLNVLILRLGTGRSTSGRSKCFSCGKTLGVSDLVPVFSYLFLLGRCRYCKSKISLQYLLVEFLSGLVFLLIYLKLEPVDWSEPFRILSFVTALLVSSVLIVITVYDFKHKIIPDKFVFIFIGLGVLVATYRLFGSVHFDTRLVFDFLAGFIFFAFFHLLWRVSRGRWIGYGDAKLSLGIGLVFGFVPGLSAIIFGFWAGATTGLLLIAFSKALPVLGLERYGLTFRMNTEIPFAPFLIFGMALVFFFNLNAFAIF